MDNIFTVQDVTNKQKARNLPTHMVFNDFKKALDMVLLKKFFEVLTKIKIIGAYILTIQYTYKNPKSMVRLGSETTKSFAVTKGLKQGGWLLLTLFEICV